MTTDPFENSETLSAWTSDVLVQRGIQEVAKWRMLEYWMQVELYRAVEAGHAGGWRYLGEYEQPYYTKIPRSGRKYNTKWVDMVLAELNLDSPGRVVWIELKDVGRSEHTLEPNLKGLGRDLAALYTLNPIKTKEIWMNPPPHAVDKGRQEEWNFCASALDVDDHLIAQIVIVPQVMVNEVGGQFVSHNWLDSFEKRATVESTKHGIHIAQTDRGGFSTFALVAPLPKDSG